MNIAEDHSLLAVSIFMFYYFILSNLLAGLKWRVRAKALLLLNGITLCIHLTQKLIGLWFIGCERKTPQSWGSRWTFIVQNQWWLGNIIFLILYIFIIFFKAYELYPGKWFAFDCRNTRSKFMNGLEQAGNHM